MNRRKKIFGKKAGVKLGAVFGIVAIVLIASYTISHSDLKEIPTVFEPDPEWQTIYEVKMEDGKLLVTGEAEPGTSTSGWLSTFCLDYAQVPGTVLQNNATDWEASGDVHAYVDTDDTETDLPSEDPFYFVIRSQFNRTHAHDGSTFIDARCRIFLTVSGDETISNVNGTAVISENETANMCIHINFYWDDEDDGYRITDDGNLDWNCTIQAKH